MLEVIEHFIWVTNVLPALCRGIWTWMEILTTLDKRQGQSKTIRCHFYSDSVLNKLGMSTTAKYCVIMRFLPRMASHAYNESSYCSDWFCFPTAEIRQKVKPGCPRVFCQRPSLFPLSPMTATDRLLWACIAEVWRLSLCVLPGVKAIEGNGRGLSYLRFR